MKKLDVQLFLLDNVIWVIVVAFFMLNVAFTPAFATLQNVINLFNNSCPMALLVLGEGLVLIVGKFDLSNESIAAFAPGMALLMATKWIHGGLPPFIGLILIIAFGALAGWVNGYGIGKIKVEPFLCTTSTMIILRGLVLFAVPFAIYPLDKVYTFVGKANLPGNIPVSILLVLGIFIVFQIIMQHTRFGRCFMATGGNTRASFIAGINTDRIIIYAFVLSGMLAAGAGLIMAGRQEAVTNQMGLNMGLLSFAGAILGGASLDGGQGTPLGMLGGALLLGLFSNSLNLLGVNVSLVYACKGGLIFAAILLDRYKVRLRSSLLHAEQLRKMQSGDHERNVSAA